MDHGEVGGKRVGIWPVIQGRVPNSPVIRVGDVVPDALDNPYPQVLPSQGGL